MTDAPDSMTVFIVAGVFTVLCVVSFVFRLGALLHDSPPDNQALREFKAQNREG